MDTLIEIENANQETALTLLQACLLCMFITFTTILGISHGKSMEKTLNHIEIPNIYYAVQHSRRIEE